MTIRVIIADDHDVVRHGLVRMFHGSDVEIVGQATDGQSVEQLAREQQPDVVLLDVRMPDGSGLDAVERIHRWSPETRVVMFSTYDNPTYVARSLARGAVDYLLKGSSREELLESLRAAARGEAPRSGPMQRVHGALQRNGRLSDGEVSLTPREAQVARHLALGLSNKEIGRLLSISEDTVKEHLQHLFRKIHVADRTQAAVWAARKGIV